MRLTLRTLLAYLDRTLDPGDESVVKDKVQSSTIASSLVDRIRGVLSSREVAAPAPEAASPNEDANTIAEYLDSTLAPELTADVERRCIESDVHLAEVAATHQVLTAALSEPVAIPANLRRRVYGLQHGPGHSQVSDGDTRLSIDPEVTEDHEPDLTETLAAAGKTIRKNKRQEGKAAAQAIAAGGLDSKSTVITPEPADQGKSHLDQRRDVAMAMAGYRPRRTIEQIDPVLSGGRPSRVVPYLVSLALVAAFLLVLSKALGPLVRGKTELADATLPIGQPERPTTLIPPKIAPRPSEALPSVTPGPAAGTGATPNQSPPPNGTASTAPANTTAGSTPSAETNPAPTNNSVPTVNPDRSTSGEPTEPTPPPSTDPPIPFSTPGGDASVVGPPASLLDSADSDANRMFEPLILGGLLDDGGLVLTQDADTGRWSQLKTDSKLLTGQVLVCPPTYRSRLVLDGGLELTMVGPTGIRLDRIDNSTNQPGRIFLTIDYGKASLMAMRAAGEISIATPAASGRMTLGTAGSVAALEVGYRRQTGADPLELGSSKATLAIDSIQGRIDWRSASESLTIPTGKRWLAVSDNSPQVFESPLTSGRTMNWIDTPVEAADSVLAATRGGLSEAINQVSKPVELALRELVVSRHEAVGALAAETLLNLGMPDVYFGPAGVLNDPQQRPNWPELVNQLQGFYDRGIPSAAMTGAVLGELEGESAGDLWRLLIGFSNDQLKGDGGDVLVTLLDHPKLAVRVIASETLRLLTGTTLGYQADRATPALRREAIRKWRARIEREPLAWPNASTNVNAPKN